MRILILLLTISLFSCDSDTVAPDNSIPDTLISDTDYNAININPEGKWTTECHYTESENIDIELWGIFSFTSNDGVVKEEINLFSDKNCELEYITDLWVGSEGTLTFKQHIETSNGLKANLYEYSFNISPPLPENVIIEMGMNFDLNSMTFVQLEGDYYYTNPLVYYLE